MRLRPAWALVEPLPRMWPSLRARRLKAAERVARGCRTSRGADRAVGGSATEADMDQRTTMPLNRPSKSLLVGGALAVALGAIVVATGGLRGRTPRDLTATTTPAAAQEQQKEVRFTQRQRTTKPLPGLDAVRVSIGDVTGGKVKLSLSLAIGTPLGEERKLANGDQVKFEHEGRAYQL